jgi:dihydrofolate reductase/thymidylate synthase
MSLAPFSIIVAVDSANGIAKLNEYTKIGELPWDSKSDMKHFRDTTIGRGKNAVIMGRVTYESIPLNCRPLLQRHCIVISRTWKQEDHFNISICSSLIEALSILGGSIKNYDEIFIAGGEQIYKEALISFLYLCKKIYITKFKTDYECDQFFPLEKVKDFDMFQNVYKTKEYTRYFFTPNINHEEYQYLNSLKHIMENGESRPDRTGVGTTSIFGMKMEYDISERLPVITTKRVSINNILRELLFFISGKTDTRILEEQGCKIWKGNTSREFLDSRGLDYEEGDIGSAYGFQWRHWGAEYDGMQTDYTDKGVDQLSELITGIKEDPHSRRHILSAWNVSQLSTMALHPCHMMCQFYVSGDRKFLDCQLYQRL